eukprot:Skav226949  [mRNA]  locus=scaffold2024:96179:99837:+ [translate_table: standard]
MAADGESRGSERFLEAESGPRAALTSDESEVEEATGGSRSTGAVGGNQSGSSTSKPGPVSGTVSSTGRASIAADRGGGKAGRYGSHGVMPWRLDDSGCMVLDGA